MKILSHFILAVSLLISLSLCISAKKSSKTHFSLLCSGKRFNIVSKITNKALGLAIRIPAEERNNWTIYYWAVTETSPYYLSNSKNWVHTSLGIQNQYNNQYLQPDEIRNAILVDWDKVRTKLEIDQVTVPGSTIIKYFNLLTVDQFSGGTFFAPDYSITPYAEYQHFKIVCL